MTESPIRIEWQTKNSHPFLKSLRNLVLTLCPQQIDLLGNKMVAMQEDTSYLLAKIENVNTAKRNITINKAQLFVLPDYQEFIHCCEKTQPSTVLRFGESYTAVFKIKVEMVPNRKDFSEFLMSK